MNKLVNIAFPVIGHHAGFLNRDVMVEALGLYVGDKSRWKDIQQTMEEDDFIILMCDSSSFNKIRSVFQKELFVRLLYSVLVDTDGLDTERHFQKGQCNARPCEIFDMDALSTALNKRFDSLKQVTPPNELRTNVRPYVRNLANADQGYFSMISSAGMGKVLTSLNWALYHAETHPDIKRTVIVLPLISVVDQTANELRTIFRDYDVTFKHHSNMNHEEVDKEEGYCKDSKHLATENWDYPIVITIIVQFSESLFFNQRSKCRKLHDPQDSVVISDEI